MNRLIKDDKGVLNKLVETLQKLNKSKCVSIPEIVHLPEFPGTDELSSQGFSPRWIIENMMEKHMCAQHYVAVRPFAFEKFSYIHMDDGKIYQYTFTNSMAFFIDVYALCHLYFLISRCGLGKWPSVMELMKIMEKKYGINTRYESMTNLKAETTTLSRIAHSFPSITSEIFSDNIASTKLFLCTVFPNLYELPHMICSPTIASLLPSLNNPPVAVLVAITLLLENYNGLRTKTPITTIYLNILRANKSTVFPESLKYELCLKWKIISRANNNYRFSPFFILCNKIAKHLIIEMRREEPSLNLLIPLL